MISRRSGTWGITMVMTEGAAASETVADAEPYDERTDLTGGGDLAVVDAGIGAHDELLDVEITVPAVGDLQVDSPLEHGADLRADGELLREAAGRLGVEIRQEADADTGIGVPAGMRQQMILHDRDDGRAPDLPDRHGADRGILRGQAVAGDAGLALDGDMVRQEIGEIDFGRDRVAYVDMAADHGDRGDVLREDADDAAAQEEGAGREPGGVGGRLSVAGPRGDQQSRCHKQARHGRRNKTHDTSAAPQQKTIR